MNRATILGNLVRDPEVRTTSTGKTVVSATVAVNRKRTNGGDAVSFIDITLWEKRGEAFATYHKKGDKVLVSGRIDMDSWEDKNGGGKRTKLYITIDDWSFVTTQASTDKTPQSF